MGFLSLWRKVHDSDIPSLEVLRKIKEEALNKLINLEGPKDPIKFLLFLHINPILIVDATGSLMKNVVVEETSSSHIMLYQLLSWFEDNTCNILKSEYAPLDQMISSKQDTSTVRNWIANWCSYKEFQTKCLKYLQNSEQLNPELKTFIRLDRAHIINSVRRWKIWTDKVHPKVKDFYTRIFGYAITVDKLEDMKKLIFAAFYLSQCKVIAKNSLADQLMKWLMTHFTEPEVKNTINVSKNLSTNLNDSVILENSQEDIEQHLEDDSMVHFINSIYKQTESTV
ncbi:hypothetical protein TKK_0002384 [Trichogramma kaykai]